MRIDTPLTRLLKIDLPIIGGAMYPCSNPELVAAVSEAGGIGVIQPVSLTYVYGHEFRAGYRKIRSMTSKPVGLNLLVEASSKVYERRILEWLDIAIEEGCRFFVTALGNPSKVTRRAKEVGGVVFHDVTERKWALKALDCGIDGLICVNSRAGGHAGSRSPADLRSELKDLGVPLVCAGGIGDESAFIDALRLGYDGVQLGTRLIATQECASHPSYKEAIVGAQESDIVLTDRVTGVPLAVINTPYLKATGLKVSSIGSYLLRNNRTKKWARMFYSLKSALQLKRSSLRGLSTKDFYQAGKSVGGIESVESVAQIIERFAAAAQKSR